ncbi:tandem-95 repeat protein [Microbacterium sp. VKM Ac-2870]|uniref:Ig-like domain-containing protein n=1 Tax=Microbacterium sp. VKM Ac-2870 TaxID=2783825 RepID=UPI00188BDE35|nr:Ig-like domain-containing protein [Microbacterium sp. VKM Ac-2870]MBF4562743.1 tandem-95 repeat protein [Microbacterium sp. VKM Ac-2870]
MKSFAWLRARPRTLISTAAVTAAALVVGFLAVSYEGKPTTEVDLNDGGVWVTKQSSLLIGHFNHSSRVLDGGLRTGSADYDLLQSGTRVLVVDSTASSIAAIDPARVIMSDSAELKPGAAVAMGSDTVAVLEPTGALWTSPFTAISGIGAQGTEPVADEGKNAKVAVGVDGTVYAASAADATVRSYGPGDDGNTVQKSSRGLDGVAADHKLSITVVGTTPYVLDHDTNTLYGGDGSRVQVPGDAVLQQPSGAADAVTLATPTALVRVPTGGGDAQTVETGSAQGTPAEPVYVAGCAYGAWSGSGRFVRDCPGDSDDTVQDVPGVEPTSVLRFRVNRDVVVLNDVFGGAAWMASDSMQRVDNWQDITPPEGDGSDEEKTTEETVQTTLPERTDKNTPPIAQDDQYGVRPGRTTVLTVLDNDTDADGDVLVASPASTPAFGTVEPINNGAALQFTAPEGATGSTSFRYTVNDGRGGEATATVTVTVHPFDVNSAPVQKRTTPITVESGGTASYNVLSDWIDPDGDDIFLKNVTADGGDEADFTPDGQITYRAIGGVQGRKDVPIVISDGSADGPGVARYDIRPLGTTVPITNSDHVVTQAGRTVTVSPLMNDTSSGSEPLRLTRVDDVQGATIVPDFANKTFTFTAANPGTYYPQYLVSAGPNSVPGLVRIDVLPASNEDLPPVAVRDIALLPVGKDVLVNVLSNDTDPSGGILVVQSVTTVPGSGVAAAVLGHETVRISDVGSLNKQVRVGYTISNGSQSATGEIVVIPVPPPDKLRPPVANDDQAIVRVGDTVTIPVLANDYHPNGDTMHVAPDLVPPLVDPADGEAFVSEDKVRFRAGNTPKTVYVTYEAVDSSGQRDAGYVTIQILPRNDDANSAPKPQDLTARTLSGSKVTIPVPLDGIDQDGDSVELVGIADAPTKGRIVETAANAFTYEAFAGSSGVDRFSYRVRDALGKDATANIQVGIAPAASVNQAPYAVRDAVTIRPGREVAVPVLANDSDPDGDEFGFAQDDPITLPDVPGLKARVSGKYLLITAPNEQMNTSLQYAITDARGARASTSVQITVDPNVPLERPIARDDRVRAEDLKDGVTAQVAVLENDDDPDGTKSDLKVTLGAGGENARVNADGTVDVQVTDQRQLITYTVTDPDGLTDSAFIRVPALSELPPSLISTKPLEVKSGETVQLPLSQYVRAAGGKNVVITEAAKVSAIHANGASLIKDQQTLVYTSADRYFGSDALTFEVTDGDGPDDATGRKATLTIPITVLPPDNQPPTMIGASMNVSPGEDAAVLDLAALATDPDPGDQGKLKFGIKGSTPDGLTASVDGTQLKVSAAASTKKGTRADLTVTADDGTTTPAEATISVVVTASTRPLASANDDVIAESAQGSTESVAVLDNDVNPFPETPLKIESAQLETGQAQVVVKGDRVEVTSDKAFVGVVVARYRVMDATGDPDRAVEGRIRITVQGKPDAPGRPVVSSIQSRTVVLSWTPPSDNGSPITGYTVTSTANNYMKQCASTTCTLDGLTNNVEYNFVVTASNKVGTSDPSMPSETARPDVRPDTPAPPTLKFGDRSLTVSWVPPRSEGSPVTSYTLEISPAPPSGIVQKTGVTGTSIVWDGLENGASYQVRVRAHNKAPDPSEFSPWSASMVPAGPPAAPNAPTTTLLEPVGSQAQIRVDWNAPDKNGDAISGYELRVLQGGSVVNTIPVSGSQTSQAVTVKTSTTDYTFDVRAQNKAGWGDRSPQSAPRRGVTAPAAPTAVAATEGNNTVGVTWQAGSGNGAAANEIQYQYSVGTGGWRSDWIGGGTNGAGTIGNGQVNNNGTYTIRVRAVSTVDGSTYASGASNASNAVSPYGPIGNPSATAAPSGTNITFSWSSPGRNGRDITTDVYIDGGLVSNAANGSITRGYGYNEAHSIEVRTSVPGQTTTASDSATTDNPPQPRVWVTRGDYVPGGPCVNGCYKFVVNTQNFTGGRYTIDCWNDSGGAHRFGTRAEFDLPSNGSKQLACYSGADGYNVWVDIVGWGSDVDTEKQWWPRN